MHARSLNGGLPRHHIHSGGTMDEIHFKNGRLEIKDMVRTNAFVTDYSIDYDDIGATVITLKFKCLGGSFKKSEKQRFMDAVFKAYESQN